MRVNQFLISNTFYTLYVCAFMSSGWSPTRTREGLSESGRGIDGEHHGRVADSLVCSRQLVRLAGYLVPDFGEVFEHLASWWRNFPHPQSWPASSGLKCTSWRTRGLLVTLPVSYYLAQTFNDKIKMTKIMRALEVVGVARRPLQLDLLRISLVKI